MRLRFAARRQSPRGGSLDVVIGFSGLDVPCADERLDRWTIPMPVRSPYCPGVIVDPLIPGRGHHDRSMQNDGS
jgi:hypothetical protein